MCQILFIRLLANSLPQSVYVSDCGTRASSSPRWNSHRYHYRRRQRDDDVRDRQLNVLSEARSNCFNLTTKISGVPHLKGKKRSPYKITLLSVCQPVKNLFAQVRGWRYYEVAIVVKY
ncbi:hypothetical protein EVAR_62898_1 [Eumeta japonica]|uniref:Uncharacterized protein n=1 Tax=Eumeta variegata TaxID=151549 RepID=A0A4C1Y8L5_EUMVA|nr:hypothetical protein EVAR_62898_1 [Eumeta japonica]